MIDDIWLRLTLTSHIMSYKSIYHKVYMCKNRFKKHYAKDYSDIIRTNSKSPEDLYSSSQKQHARSKPGDRRGTKRVLREPWN